MTTEPSTYPSEVSDKAAWDVGILAQRLASEYFTHMAALYVASDPRVVALAPSVEPGQIVPILRVERGDGTHQMFHFTHFLSKVREPLLTEDFKRAWLSSSLLRIGDALGENGYFGHAPEAELIRHLRNGIAHKNRFSFQSKVIDQSSGLLKFPAHNRRYSKALSMREYTIDVHLEGSPVLFDFGGPGVLLDILTALGWHLTRTACGFAVGTA
jgi:hypothetical protein